MNVSKINEQIQAEYVVPAGKVLVLKATRAGGKSVHTPSFVYPDVGGLVEAPDWNGTAHCGGGLHGWLWGSGDIKNAGAEWAFQDKTSEWRVLEVEASSVLDIASGKKCKFPRGAVVMVGTLAECAGLCVKHAPTNTQVIGAIVVSANYGTATAGDGGTATAGERGTATAGERGIVLLRRWDVKAERYRWIQGEVGENGIEANVPYKLDDQGKLVKKSDPK